MAGGYKVKAEGHEERAIPARNSPAGGTIASAADAWDEYRRVEGIDDTNHPHEVSWVKEGAPDGSTETAPRPVPEVPGGVPKGVEAGGAAKNRPAKVRRSE